jgi:hypothetical protein
LDLSYNNVSVVNYYNATCNSIARFYNKKYFSLMPKCTLVVCTIGSWDVKYLCTGKRQLQRRIKTVFFIISWAVKSGVAILWVHIFPYQKLEFWYILSGVEIFRAIWYILWSFGILVSEKSGNPG